MERTTPPWSARQQRHLSFLAEFTSDIRHTSGHANVVADMLSRPPPVQKMSAAAVIKEPAIALSHRSALHASNSAAKPLPPAINNLPDAVSVCTPVSPITAAPPFDYAALAAAQESCPDIRTKQASPTLRIVSRQLNDAQLLGDISTGQFRPLLPDAFRTAAIRSLHEVHHPGVRATTRLVKTSFCWPKMGKDIATVARSCLGCQLGKVHRHIKLQPETIAVPHRRFSHLHVDLVGPLPTSSGYNHLFTIIDRTTRWPEVIPLSSTSAADCAAALFSGWVQRFGLPSTITSDRGPQFTYALWSALCRLLNIKHNPTTAYHPQSNGLVERFHRRLKDGLRARPANSDWCSHLPWVMLGIRSAWRLDSKFSPAEAVYGAQPVLPGQFLTAEESPSPSFLTDLQGLLTGRAVLPTSHHNTPAPQQLPEDLLLTRHVLIRKDGHVPPLAAAYNGPYLVLERSLRFFKLQIGDRQDTVSTLRLKACISQPETEIQVAQPPTRGRPPIIARQASLPTPPTTTPSPKPQRAKRRRVTFRCPAIAEDLPPSTTQRLHPSGRPACSAGPPKRYLFTLSHLRRPRLGGEM
jgi:hypothetical protein